MAARLAKKAGDQALGRSRGGLSTKLHPAVNASGNPLRHIATAGQIANNDWSFAQGLTTVTPIIIDLDRDDEIERTNLSATNTYFDHAGDGFAERTGWVGKDDGLLAIDLDGDGRITSGQELFGQFSKTTYGRQEIASGYVALQTYDENRDGAIDEYDIAWRQLRVWQDKNSDGFTDAGELKTLDQLGIKSLRSNALATIDFSSNAPVYCDLVAFSLFIWADGEIGGSADYLFETRTRAARTGVGKPLSAEILALPELPGTGELKNLRAAMNEDDELRSRLAAANDGFWKIRSAG